MGTRGYYVFKYKGIYYIFYNHWDSYFSWLGDEIVKELRNMRKEDFENMKELVIKITESDKEKTDSIEINTKNYEGLMKALKNVKEYRLQDIQKEEPTLDIFIEYIYIIDLDKNIFKVKYNDEWSPTENRYKLDEIPLEWYKILE